ncbi:hypothetical protein KIPB_005951 [Kipferlia bialata]|uniref:RRM domain-containing protein n=1 Tax=Kipferlia bialata TaxID=797122 RepID=A0A391NU97_9EUKA|nr:hypothetical protein KIPB_005951 [Kipferlia bialata]|eukprot:g5951.t1
MGKATKKTVKAFEEPTEEVSKPSAVVYLAHIPHGFYEKEMRGFFSQFGELKHLRLSRSKKTGGSKGYAFIEFDSPETAAVVAETMDGYLLFTRILRCKQLTHAEVHADLWKGEGKAFRTTPKEVHFNAMNKAPSKETAKARKKAAKTVHKKALAALAAAGIEYELEEKKEKK